MNINKKSWLAVAILLLGACGSQPKQTVVAAEDTIGDSIYGATIADSTMALNATDEQLTYGESIDAVTSATAITNVATFNGTLVIPPQNYATLTLSMAGTVRTTSVLPGAYVKQGTVLATLENPEFITLQQIYLESHAQVEFLDKEYQRQQALAQGEAASQKKLQQSRADYLSMKSRHDAASAQLSLLGVSPQTLLTGGIIPLLEVKAPINGYISKVALNLGKHIAAGEPLCEIVDKSKTLLCITAYEKDLIKIKVGDSVQFRVNGLGNKTFNAILISVGQQVDLVNRSLEVYASVTDNDPQFRPGMYVSARVAKK